MQSRVGRQTPCGQFFSDCNWWFSDCRLARACTQQEAKKVIFWRTTALTRLLYLCRNYKKFQEFRGRQTHCHFDGKRGRQPLCLLQTLFGACRVSSAASLKASALS